MSRLEAPPLAAGWNWSTFQGSYSALKWNRRGLWSLTEALTHVQQTRVAVQAGGNLGIFPKALARVFESVYTFEPASDLFRKLVLNAPEKNIIKFQAALGCDRRLVGLSRVRRDGKPDNHEGITHVAGDGRIPTLRLDDLNLPICDLLYLDVEGYELFALEGARETIARCRPMIAVEINRGIEFVGLTRDDVRTWIRAQHYTAVGASHSDEFFVPTGAA